MRKNNARYGLNIQRNCAQKSRKGVDVRGLFASYYDEYDQRDAPCREQWAEATAGARSTEQCNNNAVSVLMDVGKTASHCEIRSSSRWLAGASGGNVQMQFYGNEMGNRGRTLPAVSMMDAAPQDARRPHKCRVSGITSRCT